ncbi:shikimate kinase [uncultured Croceitalea sp.]|uniref:shikimate kinase n=1 Tax=uncultured Croceitalea sp. TaxID=1798908 RepID=UPI00374F4A43
MKLVLVGYMASGKSTIGQILADDLKIDFIDLDTAIADSVGLSVPELFKTKGEVFFRKKETLFLEELLDTDKDLILATGGGTPCYGNNMDIILEKATHSLYLKLSIPSLVGRIIMQKENRPLVSNITNEDLPEFIGKHLFERSSQYERASNIINCDSKTIDELKEEIKDLLL